MKRLITEKLVEWANSSIRKPLLLRGARQVGKTFSVKEFGEKIFSGNLHIIDLEQHPEWHAIFEKNLEPIRIVAELELVLNSQIDISTDLLFLDEIQSCPRALLALRYFFEEMPNLRVIAAGSLLEFALSEISYPVGRVQSITMYPMNFSEFLYAVGKNLLAEKLLNGETNFSDTIHEMLLTELKRYFFVGGMPEAVQSFVQTGKLRSAFEVQRDLILTFRNDFSKYGRFTDRKCIDNVFVSVSRFVGNQIKYTKLSEDFSSHTIKKAFNLLCDANVIQKIPSVSQAGLPFGAFSSHKKFKALFLDIGLLQNISGLPVDFEYQKSNLLSIYNGKLAEQFVGQELLSRGNNELYYWARNSKSSTAEVDFLTSKNGEIIPVEVKSGPSGRLKSLHLFLKLNEKIKTGYVLQQNKYSEIPEQRIKFLPLYSAYNF